ncbi:B12-binding domain-containing radical SAM protein [Leadbettera azotonutricia]|uniref:Radical SAM n=1 Tax=Leadbettera azotonutricia (strain ATCC BAA-888 / DSM 13862 / ZAS-9) TaxID=545695 RepID=F5YCQ0_LEAAZ|nr:radical SAM protein [Leadbettera azotonutricia]AEF80093.1 radical SAM [Leadbettera azotonutricia ZAS-9]
MNSHPLKEAVLIQPPFVQLNSPYPALYYLRAFLEKEGYKPIVKDHSIGLFERIFCRQGLERIFEDARNAAEIPGRFSNEQIRYNAERFLSEEKLWIASIDRLVNFLKGRDREWGHLLALANGSVPGGPRFDACIDEYSGDVPPDAAKILGSRLLEDLADFITVVLDPGFSLIRYVPTLNENYAAGFAHFENVEKSLDGYIMQTFYLPFLEEEWDSLKLEEPFLLGLTIPFPGCLTGALVCAASAKRRFGEKVVTCAGGGYINTELRFMKVKGFYNYFDCLSIDRGYGFLSSVMKGLDINTISTNTKCIDDDAVAKVFPDYTGVDFFRYLCPVDDANAMHRLWSDGRWIKAYLAHGCYWHSCSFCDVTLDYIKHFIPVDVEALFHHLVDQANNTGIRGVHLVDEAAPVQSLLKLALLNREAGLPLNFWGNIRFEKAFTPDIAAMLALGGLTGVSAGIEVATEAGLRRLGKGIELKDIVKACAAFKEAGILTHAYLIFGYWDEDEQEIIDSAEILRQFFANGLLDSAFWHKFTLTRHSRIYAEKQRGLHPKLKISGDEEYPNRFALNDLSFEGEDKFAKYSEPLDSLLSSWMAHGINPSDTQSPVMAGFPFKVKKPSVPPDLVQALLDEYALGRNMEREALPENITENSGKARVIFLGSQPMLNVERNTLKWRWRLADHELKLPRNTGASADGAKIIDSLVNLLETASCGEGIKTQKFYEGLECIPGLNAAQTWRQLRQSGLAEWK